MMNGSASSIANTSEENRLTIRPIGVTSKKDIGAWNIDWNIGIKHDSLCINICWAPRELLKPEPGRPGFQHLPRGPADKSISENHV